MENKENSPWTLMYIFLKDRIIKPWRYPSYAMYFVIIIIFVGSIGIIRDLLNVEWCWNCQIDEKEISSFAFNLTGISLALTTASVIDLIFISKRTIEAETKEEKYSQTQIENLKISIRIFGLVSLIIIFIIWILVNSFLDASIAKIIFAILSLFFSYLIWWISNVRNKILNKYEFTIGAQLGGNLSTISTQVYSSNDQVNQEETQNANENLPGTTETFKT